MRRVVNLIALVVCLIGSAVQAQSQEEIDATVMKINAEIAYENALTEAELADQRLEDNGIEDEMSDQDYADGTDDLEDAAEDLSWGNYYYNLGEWGLAELFYGYSMPHSDDAKEHFENVLP